MSTSKLFCDGLLFETFYNTRLWLDIETSGLDENKNNILEIGLAFDSPSHQAEISFLVLPDSFIKEIESMPFSRRDFLHYEEIANKLDLTTWCRREFSQNGLLDDILNIVNKQENLSSYSINKVEQQILNWLKECYNIVKERNDLAIPLPEFIKTKYIPAGLNLNFDMKFLKKFCPSLTYFFHYQWFECSTFNFLPENPTTEKSKYNKAIKHRALEDIKWCRNRNEKFIP